jgi:hypothetical protein
MKYLIFLIFISISFANDSINQKKLEYSFEDFFKSEIKVILFKSSDGKTSKKFDCVELKNFCNSKKNYEIELISSNKSTLMFIPNFEIYKKTFYPLLILNENQKKREYQKQIKDAGNSSFDYSEIDYQLSAAVNKTIEFPYSFELINSKTLIFFNDKYELNHFSDIEKIIFHEK